MMTLSIFILLLYLVIGLRPCSSDVKSLDAEKQYSVMKMELKSLNLFAARRYEYNFSIDSHFTNYPQICELLVPVKMDARRCIMLLSRSVRLLKINAAGDLSRAALDDEELFEHPIDGTNFRLSYAYGYDSTPHLDNVPTNICIVGQAPLQLLLSLRLVHPSSKVTIYLAESSFFDYRVLHIAHEMDLQGGGNFATIVNADLMNAEGDDIHVGDVPKCDVVHIRDSSIRTEPMFYSVLARLTRLQTAPVTVIWERVIPQECVPCLRLAENCTDPTDLEAPGGYAKLVNVTLSRLCYEQHRFRSRLMQRRPTTGGENGPNSLAARMFWEYSARTDRFSRYNLEPYLNGFYNQILRFDQDSPIEMYFGMLYSAPLSAGDDGNRPVAEPQDVDSTNIRLLTAADLGGVRSVEIDADSSSPTTLETAPGASAHQPPQPFLQRTQQLQEELNKSELTIFVTYGNRVFDDTAFGLQDALRRIGYSRTCVMGDWDVPMYRGLLAGLRDASDCAVFDTNDYEEDYMIAHNENQFRDSRATGALVLQIALGPHEPSMFAPHYIALQMEHPWSSFFRYSEYVKTFADAALVWCFTEHHREHMVNVLNFPAEQVQVVPIYTKSASFPDVTTPAFHQVVVERNWTVRTAEMYFSGSYSPYREEVVSLLYDWAGRDGLLVEFACLKWTMLPFAEDRHLVLSNSKVVLNIHRDERSSLEVHRVNHLLSMGKCVVSERSSTDPDVDAAYEGAIVFADNITHLYDVALQLTRDPVARRLQEQAALRKFAEIQSDTAQLQRSMRQVHTAMRVQLRPQA